MSLLPKQDRRGGEPGADSPGSSPLIGGVIDFFPKTPHRSDWLFWTPWISHRNSFIQILQRFTVCLAMLTCAEVARAFIGEPHHVSAGESYYRCPNHDDQHPSLKINPSKDKWICGPCNASGGAWSLAAFFARYGANEKQAIAKWLAEHGLGYEKHERAPKKEEKFFQVKAFYYTPVLRNVRLETRPTNGAKPEKKFHWEHLEGEVWKPGGGGMPKPLYVNERFKKGEPFDFAVGFEGEGKCDLAGELGIPGFSYKYMTRVECQKLNGLGIVLWPDADQPGWVQAKNAALILKEAGLKTRMCSIPIEFPIGGDIVDAVKILRWTREQIDKFLASATPYPPEIKIGKRLVYVEAKRMEWMWKDRIPCNGITILDGDPGTGKSLMVTDLAARISTGRLLPFDSFQMPPANVIVLSSEDSLEHTIRPRFEAAGADLERIIAIPYNSETPGELCFTRIPQNLKILSRAIDQEQAKLVIIDVLVSYISPELKTHNDQDVRLALAPLADLCDKKNIACICNRHLNKNQGASAIYRGGGSIGMTGAARSVLLLTRGDGDIRTLAVIKSNLGVIPPTANFLVITENEMPIVKWTDEIERTADDLLASAGLVTDIQSQRKEAYLNDTIQFLTEFLSDGRRLADEVIKEAREQCIMRNKLYEAKAIMRVRSYKREGRWWWELPNTSKMLNS